MRANDLRVRVKEITDLQWRQLAVFANAKYRAMWNILRFTGLGIGVVCRLRVSDVYLPDGTVREAILIRERVKDEGRKVSIPKRLRKYLEKCRSKVSGYWLFPSDAGCHRPVSGSEFRRYLESCIGKAGFDVLLSDMDPKDVQQAYLSRIKGVLDTL